ncbi:MAG TPA: potassium transporter TrkG [bacterium]|nr:potassium transporter TrkG [bacterium]
MSTGITANLSPIGLLVIIILMILGRIGPLSIALAAVPSHTAQEKEYPTEAIMIG